MCVGNSNLVYIYIHTHCKRHLQHYNEQYVHAHSQGYYKLTYIYRLHYIFLYLHIDHIDKYNDIGKNGRIQK